MTHHCCDSALQKVQRRQASVMKGWRLRCATSKAAGAFTARISTFCQNCVPKTDSLVYDVGRCLGVLGIFTIIVAPLEDLAIGNNE
jgi:hypothetical protein